MYDSIGGITIKLLGSGYIAYAEYPRNIHLVKMNGVRVDSPQSSPQAPNYCAETPSSFLAFSKSSDSIVRSTDYIVWDTITDAAALASDSLRMFYSVRVGPAEVHIFVVVRCAQTHNSKYYISTDNGSSFNLVFTLDKNTLPDLQYIEYFNSKHYFIFDGSNYLTVDPKTNSTEFHYMGLAKNGRSIVGCKLISWDGELYLFHPNVVIKLSNDTPVEVKSIGGFDCSINGVLSGRITVFKYKNGFSIVDETNCIVTFSPTKGFVYFDARTNPHEFLTSKEHFSSFDMHRVYDMEKRTVYAVDMDDNGDLIHTVAYIIDDLGEAE